MSQDLPRRDVHLSDEELLRAADGELSARQVVKIRTHLSSCASCQARQAEFDVVLADMQQSYRDVLDAQLPYMAVPRAALRARLADAVTKTSAGRSWWRFLQFPAAIQTLAMACLLFGLALTAVKILVPRRALNSANAALAVSRLAAIPNRNLTPGAVRAVSLGEVCSIAHEEVERDVPGSLRDQVLHEYGIANARASDYEIDYLIAPGLGGTEDIHNLWPESYSSPTWNAHVKDSLEEHLHELVCTGQVDLHTAQKDISTDWIAAYKKYFHSDQPVGEHVAAVRQGALAWAKLGLS
jgi:hypothetical protein